MMLPEPQVLELIVPLKQRGFLALFVLSDHDESLFQSNLLFTLHNCYRLFMSSHNVMEIIYLDLFAYNLAVLS